MTSSLPIGRRRVLQLGAVAGVSLAATSKTAALAAPADAPQVEVTDLGPGVTNFSLAAGIPVGDRVYVASRNIDPMRIVGYDLTTDKVTSVTAGPGISTQLLAADPEGRYLYAAVDERGMGQPGFLRVDLSKPDAPKEDLASIPGLSPYAIAMAPDGVLYFGGLEKNPALRRYDPATGELTTIVGPDPNVPMIRSLFATEDRLYVGTGASLGVTPTSTQAGLFVMDRATNQYASILPQEFVGAVEVRDVAIDGDSLYACSTTAAGAAVAVMDVANPGEYRLLQSDRPFLRLPRVLGNKVYFNGGALIELSLDAGLFREITVPDADFGEIWGLWIRDGKVMVVSAFGLVFEVDPADGATKIHDLIAGGAPTGPQLAMSVHADLNGVYVGGTNSVMYHDLRSETQTRILAQSEAKDILIRDRTAYFAQYNAIGVLAYDPRTDGEWPRRVAPFPPAQNRPHQIVWDDRHKVALIGLQSDTEGGGSLLTFDPATSRTTEAINPIDSTQMVRAVAVHDGIAYLGGQNVGNTGGTVVAWDPVRRKELWRLTPQAKPTGVTGLAVLGGRLYVMCHRGDFFVLDLATRRILHSSNHRAAVPSYGTLLVSRGRVYATSSSTFFRFDPKTFARTDLVTLDAEWYGIPRSAVDTRGTFYAIRGRNLVRVRIDN
ncbi:outer membrane protein assembly factor BamB family protein [Kribbella sp. NPDC054772]